VVAPPVDASLWRGPLGTGRHLSQHHSWQVLGHSLRRKQQAASEALARQALDKAARADYDRDGAVLAQELALKINFAELARKLNLTLPS